MVSYMLPALAEAGLSHRW